MYFRWLIVFFVVLLASQAFSENSCWNDRLVSKGAFCFPIQMLIEASREHCAGDAQTVEKFEFSNGCGRDGYKEANFTCCGSSNKLKCDPLLSMKKDFSEQINAFPKDLFIEGLKSGDFMNFKLQLRLQQLVGSVGQFAYVIKDQRNSPSCEYEKLMNASYSLQQEYHRLLPDLLKKNSARVSLIQDAILAIIDGKSTCGLEEQLREFNVDSMLKSCLNGDEISKMVAIFPELTAMWQKYILNLQLSTTPAILAEHLTFLENSDAHVTLLQAYKRIINEKQFGLTSEEVLIPHAASEKSKVNVTSFVDKAMRVVPVEMFADSEQTRDIPGAIFSSVERIKSMASGFLQEAVLDRMTGVEINFRKFEKKPETTTPSSTIPFSLMHGNSLGAPESPILALMMPLVLNQLLLAKAKAQAVANFDPESPASALTSHRNPLQSTAVRDLAETPETSKLETRRPVSLFLELLKQRMTSGEMTRPGPSTQEVNQRIFGDEAETFLPINRDEQIEGSGFADLI